MNAVNKYLNGPVEFVFSSCSDWFLFAGNGNGGNFDVRVARRRRNVQAVSLIFRMEFRTTVENIFIIHFLLAILSPALKPVRITRALHCLFEAS